MDTSGCEQQWIHIAALRLPEENFYVTNVFKLVSLAIPQSSFWPPNLNSMEPSWLYKRSEHLDQLGSYGSSVCSILLDPWLLFPRVLEYSNPLEAPWTLLCFPIQVLTLHATSWSPGFTSESPKISHKDYNTVPCVKTAGIWLLHKVIGWEWAISRERSGSKQSSRYFRVVLFNFLFYWYAKYSRMFFHLFSSFQHRLPSSLNFPLSSFREPELKTWLGLFKRKTSLPPGGGCDQWCVVSGAQVFWQLLFLLQIDPSFGICFAPRFISVQVLTS